MSSYNEPANPSGESGRLSDLQFDLNPIDFDGIDWDCLPVPSLSYLQSLTGTDPAQNTRQPLCPETQSRRTASPVTPRRRSSSRSNNVSISSMTWGGRNGRKKSCAFPYANTLEPLFLGLSADLQLDQQVSVPSQPHAVAVSSPVSQSQVCAVQQKSSQAVGYAPPATQNIQNEPEAPLGSAKQRQTPAHLQPPVPNIQHQGLGGRPPPPPEIEPFLNAHHIPQNHGRVPDKRGLKDTTVANDFYYSISHLPALCLPISKKNVSYSGVEFEHNMKFTTDEFLEYLHCASQRPDHTRRPILRIQIQPAQCNHRYIRGGASFKCRFSDCPDKRGTILKGQARVCINEFNDERGDWLNPFHNTGYVHLYCLERQLNLIELYQSPDILILAENRKLEHEPPSTTNPRTNNPMALNDVERGVVDEWLREVGHRWQAFQVQHPDLRTRPSFVLEEQDKLFHRLTKAHLQNPATQCIQKKRKIKAAGRATAHLDEFVGDVSKHAALRKRMLAEKRRGCRSNTTTTRSPASPEPLHKRRRKSPPDRIALVEYQPCALKAVAPLACSASPHGSVRYAQVSYTPAGLYSQPGGHSPPCFPGPTYGSTNYVPVSMPPDPEADRSPRCPSLPPEGHLALSRLGHGSPLTAEVVTAQAPPTAATSRRFRSFSSMMAPPSQTPRPEYNIDDPGFFQIGLHVEPVSVQPRTTTAMVVGVVGSPISRRASMVVAAGVGKRRRSSGRSSAPRRSSRLSSSSSAAALEAALYEYFDAQNESASDPRRKPAPGINSRVIEEI